MEFFTMHDSKQIIKKGTILTFSSGAYEDYNVSSVYSVNKEFNINDLQYFSLLFYDNAYVRTSLK